jgi:hypothetical protein
VKNIPVTAVPPLKTQNPNQKPKSKPAKLMMDDQGNGVRATLIDLGLARMDAGDGDGGERVHWTPLDEEIFMGEGKFILALFYALLNDVALLLKVIISLTCIG